MSFKKSIFLFSFSLIIIQSSVVFGFDRGKDSQNKPDVELIFAQDELEKMSKWKEKTFNEMVVDAMNGDGAALYMVGMFLLTGASGLPIDVEKADSFLEKSASLGFAPAIKQMINKYEEEENPFLVMVYCNLLTSFGHQEFVLHYHDLRRKLNETFGVGVSKEIERVASLKKDLILKNHEALKNALEKMKFVLAMCYNDSLITCGDSNYNNDYWFRFSKFQSYIEEEADQFECSIRDGYPDFERKYEVSRQNVIKLLDVIKNNEKISDLQAKFLGDTKSAIRSVENFKNCIEIFCNSTNSNVKMLANEFCLLCNYANGVLENHYKFILSPNDCLESDANLNSYNYNTTQFKSQCLHIEKIFKELGGSESQ